MPARAWASSPGGVEQVVDAIHADLIEGQHHRVDLGLATSEGDEHYFVSVLCTGFDARVNARANGYPRLAGQRYMIAMVRELATFSPLPFVVTTQGESTAHEAMILTVGNGPRYGGGMRICPAADVTDGLLDVTMLTRVSGPRLLWSFRLVFSGRHVNLPFVRTWRTGEIGIACPGATAYADGERLGPLPVRVRVAPLALRVVGTARHHAT